MGFTEQNWCLVVEGGTGITVSAFLFGLTLSKATVQAAVNKLLFACPFLRSQIVTVGQKLFFELSSEKKTVLVKETANPCVGQDDEEKEEEEPSEMWLKIVDLELNILFPKTKPIPILEVHLYNRGLPDSSSLVVLRAHTAAADMASTGPIGSKFLNSLKDAVQQGSSGETEASGLEEEFQQKAALDDEGIVGNFEYYKAMEKAIPKRGADKPFWAHGTDVIGYGLASRKHAFLPFRSTEQQRKSHLIRASLSKDATDRLLEVCKERSTDLYGALTAAGLTSVATFKNVGNKGENYGVVVLYNCRELLDPKLPEDALGFYHSAISKTVHTKENQEFWKFAAVCTEDFQDAINKRKHFTDMGNLNMLMVQAIRHPGLTPSSTLRTALFSLLHDPVVETTSANLAEVLQLKDFVSASSTQGVGPCFAVFPSLRDGALHLSFVYCSPLSKRRDIQTLIDSFVSYITI